MSENGYPQARHSRLWEVTLWSAAALLMLSVHAGFAYYLMQEPDELEAGGPPPAAIIIEMAAIARKPSKLKKRRRHRMSRTPKK